jgi:membrane protein insertase Oxa1/YidC/SpoIIIJ
VRFPRSLVTRSIPILHETIYASLLLWESVAGGGFRVRFAGSGMIPFLAQLLDAAHTATGQPWWVVISSAVIAVRLVAIPLSIRGMAAGSRLRSVTPYISLYRKQQQEAAKRQDKHAVRAAMAQVSKLQKQYGTSMLSIASPIVLQMVMGIWMFTTLRRMGLEADGIEGMLVEGLPWATDLSANEYTLPALVTITGLITAELSRGIAPKHPPPGSFNPDTMRNISRGFAVFGGAIMTTLPAVSPA